MSVWLLTSAIADSVSCVGLDSDTCALNSTIPGCFSSDSVFVSPASDTPFNSPSKEC